MLGDLLNEQSFVFSLLVEDSVGKSGNCIISSIVDKLSNKEKQIICVHTEPTFTHQFESHRSNVHSVNIFGQYDTLQERILTAANQYNCVVVFPSISLLLMKYGVAKFGRLLRCLKDCEHVTSLIALIHTDVLETEETLQVLEYMFDAVVTVLPVEEAELLSSYYGHAKCVRRKANGKIDISDEYFTLNDLMNVDVIHASSSAAIKALVVEESSKDITANLTFNLSLSDKERDAKNKLQLPYLKKESEKLQMLSKSSSSGAPQVRIGGGEATGSSGGKIYYQYDEADDFDEEDPDDDLDF